MIMMGLKFMEGRLSGMFTPCDCQGCVKGRRCQNQRGMSRPAYNDTEVRSRRSSGFPSAAFVLGRDIYILGRRGLRDTGSFVTKLWNAQQPVL